MSYLVEALTEFYRIPVYCYRFNVLTAGLAAEVGSTYFQEVAFVFDNVHAHSYAIDATNPFLGQPPTYVQLAKLMSRV
jgi:hypothetical protein